jgi:hypothetical protein
MFQRNMSPPSSESKNKQETSMKQIASSHSLTPKVEAACSFKSQLTFNRIHSVISQKTEIFIATTEEPYKSYILGLKEHQKEINVILRTKLN